MEVYGEAWASNYERLANAGIPGREGLYRLCRASFLDLSANARILVIGCGTGVELISLAHAFPEASFVGIDPAQAMLAFCAGKVSAEGLSSRVHLQPVGLDGFAGEADFDAVTSILVSQHIPLDHQAAEFFRKIAALLKPGGRLYTADLHIAGGQNRTSMLALWHAQALMSGIEPAIVETTSDKFHTELRPRDEAVITDFLRSAGFVEILKPFSSLLYGAWSCRRPL